MPVSRFEGRSSFSSGNMIHVGAVAYKQLLLYLVASGCTLTHFDLRAEGANKIVLHYKVEGTYEQVKAFRDEIRKDHGRNHATAVAAAPIVAEKAVVAPTIVVERAVAAPNRGWTPES